MRPWCHNVSGISCAKSELQKADPVLRVKIQSLKQRRTGLGHKLTHAVRLSVHHFHTKLSHGHPKSSDSLEFVDFNYYKCWTGLARNALCCPRTGTAHLSQLKRFLDLVLRLIVDWFIYTQSCVILDFHITDIIGYLADIPRFIYFLKKNHNILPLLH